MSKRNRRSNGKKRRHVPVLGAEAAHEFGDSRAVSKPALIAAGLSAAIPSCPKIRKRLSALSGNQGNKRTSRLSRRFWLSDDQGL